MGLGRRQQQQQQPGDISARASTATCSPTETKEERKRLGTPVGSAAAAAALQPGSPDPLCLGRTFLHQVSGHGTCRTRGAGGERGGGNPRRSHRVDRIRSRRSLGVLASPSLFPRLILSSFMPCLRQLPPLGIPRVQKPERFRAVSVFLDIVLSRGEPWRGRQRHLPTFKKRDSNRGEWGGEVVSEASSPECSFFFLRSNPKPLDPSRNSKFLLNPKRDLKLEG